MQKAWVRSLDWEPLLEKEWQPAPVFLPGKSHGQRSLVGYSPWGCKRVGHDLATEQQQRAIRAILYTEHIWEKILNLQQKEISCFCGYRVFHACSV